MEGVDSMEDQKAGLIPAIGAAHSSGWAEVTGKKLPMSLQKKLQLKLQPEAKKFTTQGHRR